MSQSLVSEITQSRVSSVLNKDTKQFGKKYLFDGDNETCWNSDQGTPQWVIVTFQQAVKIEEIYFQFQGGFVGKDCRLEGRLGQEEFKLFKSFSPQDTNQLQDHGMYHTGKFAETIRAMERYQLDIMGVCELRWSGGGEKALITGQAILYSGRNDDQHLNRVALILSKKAKATLLKWEPMGERLRARLNSKLAKLTIIVCYAPQEDKKKNSTVKLSILSWISAK